MRGAKLTFSQPNNKGIRDKPDFRYKITQQHMGLSYHFKLYAPASTSVEALVETLRQIESEAQKMGFDPTMVLNATFDSSERRDFARRLTSGLRIQDEQLKTSETVSCDNIWGHDPITGICRIVPEQAVVLVITDENAVEYCFGFFRYPSEIVIGTNRISICSKEAGGWKQHEFFDSSDSRLRSIIALLRDAGFVSEEQDEFAALQQDSSN